MTSGLFSPGLKRRYAAATAGVSAAALLIAAAMLYAHSTGVLTSRGLTIAVLATLAVAGVTAVTLIVALANSFVQPLRAVRRQLDVADLAAAADRYAERVSPRTRPLKWPLK